MNKPGSLRAAIEAAMPRLVESPERLTVFIDNGSLAATGAKGLSFEYRYVCHALLLDFSGDADALFLAIIEWVRANQPDLLLNPDERAHGITYEIDILDNETSDVSIKLQLTESVVVKVNDNGSRTFEHVDDSQHPDGITWTGQPWTN
ncbi:P2 phage tail completion protein R (GpR) [Burkholderia cepacia]|uniref:phage tail protein n=1 Tax=Burkholderia cepacia TaxID=292 RepID=UPI0008D5DD4D|nr:phage tail protein [Burkholderia cepacia]SES99296.1 P2 phage tail completion protein R (GpR) [Burkholderia cepacia]